MNQDEGRNHLAAYLRGSVSELGFSKRIVSNNNFALSAIEGDLSSKSRDCDSRRSIHSKREVYWEITRSTSRTCFRPLNVEYHVEKSGPPVAHMPDDVEIGIRCWIAQVCCVNLAVVAVRSAVPHGTVSNSDGGEI